jgi:hypothetical protein
MKSALVLLLVAGASAYSVSQPPLARFVQKLLSDGDLPAQYTPPAMPGMDMAPPVALEQGPVAPAPIAPRPYVNNDQLPTLSFALAPEQQFLPPVNGVPGAVRLKKRYGPYVLQSSNVCIPRFDQACQC